MMQLPRNEQFETSLKQGFNNSPYYLHMGMRLLEFTDHGTVVELDVDKKLRNMMGITHGGSIAGLVDSACGTTAAQLMQGERMTVTLDLRVQYFEPVKSGKITARGWVVHRTKRYVMTEGEVRNDEQRLVARGSCIHSVLFPREDE